VGTSPWPTTRSASCKGSATKTSTGEGSRTSFLSQGTSGQFAARAFLGCAPVTEWHLCACRMYTACCVLVLYAHVPCDHRRLPHGRSPSWHGLLGVVGW
jgi:hypothetical protein